jgi:MFS family permease
VATGARYAGALALLAVGLDHLQQYAEDSYSVIPTIGTLFLLNFASASVIAAGLAAPVHRLPGLGGRLAIPALACSGIGVAAGSLVGLLVSESSGLFGFMETGYRSAIVVSIVLEVATIVLLGAHLVLRGRGPLASPLRRRVTPEGRPEGSS